MRFSCYTNQKFLIYGGSKISKVICVCTRSALRKIPQMKNRLSTAVFWGEKAGNRTGRMKPHLDIQPYVTHCESGLYFHDQCFDLGTLVLSGQVPTYAFLLACLDGRVLGRFAHMVIAASALTCASEVLQMDRFSVGEHQHWRCYQYSCKCYDLNPKLHRSYREKRGMAEQLDYCVAYSFTNLEVSQPQLCVSM